MRKLLRLYDSANMVAKLWMLSPLLPFGLATRDPKVAWMPYASAVIVFVLGVSVSRYRSLRISEGNWGWSDVAAYLAVPVALFLLFSWVVLFHTVEPGAHG